MIKVENLCKKCMMELSEGQTVCPYCGFEKAGKIDRPSMALPEQTILNGKYLLGPVLGQGGFGITYLAVDLTKELRVAIKEYFPIGLVSRTVSSMSESHETGEGFTDNIRIGGGDARTHFRNGMRRFRREAETLIKLRRQNGIVNVFDFFEENGTAYMVMEYIAGIPLKTYMAQQQKKTGKPLSWENAISIMEPVMTSLEEVHEAGIVHRDVSPDNILIDVENGAVSRVTLIDFGSSKEELAALSNKSMTIMVKHGYAPEEQYRAHGVQGAWTDIYALCATLYHMISGNLPKDAIERMMQDSQVPLKELALNPAVPAEISDVIEKGMKLRAKDRYQSIGELKKDLSAAVEAEHTRAEKAERAKQEAELLAAREARREKQKAELLAAREAGRAKQEADLHAAWEAKRAEQKAELLAAREARRAKREAEKKTGKDSCS